MKKRLEDFCWWLSHKKSLVNCAQKTVYKWRPIRQHQYFMNSELSKSVMLVWMSPIVWALLWSRVVWRKILISGWSQYNLSIMLHSLTTKGFSSCEGCNVFVYTKDGSGQTSIFYILNSRRSFCQIFHLCSFFRHSIQDLSSSLQDVLFHFYKLAFVQRCPLRPTPKKPHSFDWRQHDFWYSAPFFFNVSPRICHASTLQPQKTIQTFAWLCTDKGTENDIFFPE